VALGGRALEVDVAGELPVAIAAAQVRLAKTAGIDAGRCVAERYLIFHVEAVGLEGELHTLPDRKALADTGIEVMRARSLRAR
jgi:hypothetical protein